LFLKKDGEYYFYHNDHLGTPQKLTARNGKVVWSARYASFGSAQPVEQEVQNPLRFPGQYYDQETGLHYNYNRYHDPQLGRYLKTDPIGLNSGDFTLYVYGSNNPLKYIDPYGYEVLDPSMASSLADVESTPSTGLSEIGAGAYYGPGAEFSYSSTTCCEDGKLYKVKIVTACGGVGLAGKGKFSLSATISKITSRKGCPKTRYYFKHENSFGIRSTSIQFDKRNIMLGEINVGMKGLGTIWVFCSDTVISKTEIGCCK
jgi:RHS repeat-associated protein